jgi:hypothetical protein
LTKNRQSSDALSEIPQARNVTLHVISGTVAPIFVYLVPRYHLPDTLHIDPHSDVMGTLILALHFSEAVELRSRQCERHPESGDIRSSLLITRPLHPTAPADTYQFISSYK